MDILKGRPKISGRVEIARSFSYKLDMKRYDPWFENRDFFCSEKAECEIEDAEAVSEALYAFCKREVMASVREYVQEMKKLRRTA